MPVCRLAAFWHPVSMAATQGTGFTDAALVRLLRSLQASGASDAATAGTADEFTQRLGAWLRWTDAPPLFAALNDAPAAPPPAADEDNSLPAAEADCRSVHALLLHAITQDAPWLRRAPARPRAGSGWLPAAAAPGLDWPAYRRHYHDRQHDMAERIAPLRARLRRALQLQSPALARLAALDEVMERALAEPEQRLSALSAPLEQRHAHWRAQAAGHDAPDDTPDAPWRAAFQRELQDWLLAELDLRWQPIAALLAALREHMPANAPAPLTHTPT